LSDFGGSAKEGAKEGAKEEAKGKAKEIGTFASVAWLLIGGR
jgi:hypothetical protein